MGESEFLERMTGKIRKKAPLFERREKNDLNFEGTHCLLIAHQAAHVALDRWLQFSFHAWLSATHNIIIVCPSLMKRLITHS